MHALRVFDVLFAIITTVSSARFQPREPTQGADNELRTDGWSPKPTQAPSFPRLAGIKARDLFGRQDALDTCAWVSGNIHAPFTCFAGGNCGWFTAPNYFVCCSTDGYGQLMSDDHCRAATTCIDYDDNTIPPDYLDAVTTDSMVQCASPNPSCGTVFITGIQLDTLTYSFYTCGTAPTTIGMLRGTYIDGGNAAYDGPTVVTSLPPTTAPPVLISATTQTSVETQTETQVLTQSVAPGSSIVSTQIVVSVQTLVSTMSTATSSTSMTSPLTTDTSTTIPPTTSPALGGSSFSASIDEEESTSSSLRPSSATATSNSASAVSPAVNASTSSSPTHNSSHTGAIAGGVVGGVAGIALVAAIIGYLARRKRQARKAVLPEISQAPVNR
ncbi:hypothetical protein LTR56_014450 [Elasticomyces elasticus]|nr:hypothetical protein LTR56_014450 [Elasticomyces elasticus]KAK3646508.1 hypothetical protein LTR22_014271 [Elasticomyces elasticus]KAK4908575.1 hypothetical protein LTR49_022533 [Elasticomyces elasticus]KAK5755681.1 hypothetical protein LTS12_014242 [Elasticomyces elasticus]